jgi:hypothetical protein
MERGHEFTINLRGAGTYIIRLLEGVQIEMAEGTTIGRSPAFDLEAKGDHRVIGFGVRRSWWPSPNRSSLDAASGSRDVANPRVQARKLRGPVPARPHRVTVPVRRAHRHARAVGKHHAMIRLKYGAMLVVRTGDTATAGSVASSICPFPKNSATLWLPSGP